MKDIIFFSTVEGVSDVCPIVPALKSLPVWTNVAKEKYIKEKNDSNERVSHLYQCPGIFDL
jgi:hypothetical protein